jgi:hypothetical protein
MYAPIGAVRRFQIVFTLGEYLMLRLISTLSAALAASAAFAGHSAPPPVSSPTLGEFALIGLAVGVAAYGAKFLKRKK